jgi:predicted Zn-dependent protease
LAFALWRMIVQARSAVTNSTMAVHDHQLREATDGADDGELFLERRRSEALVFDDGRVKNASYDAAEGFGLRAVRARWRAMPIPPRSPRPR